MEQEKGASKSRGVGVGDGELGACGDRCAGVCCVGGGVGEGAKSSMMQHFYLLPKWHLYLPKLSFDSMPHTEPQITFNSGIKSGSKECRWGRWRRRAALVSADAAAAVCPASVTHSRQVSYQEDGEVGKKKKKKTKK